VKTDEERVEVSVLYAAVLIFCALYVLAWAVDIAFNGFDAGRLLSAYGVFVLSDFANKRLLKTPSAHR
jgi:hypothetical protein